MDLLIARFKQQRCIPLPKKAVRSPGLKTHPDGLCRDVGTLAPNFPAKDLGNHMQLKSTFGCPFAVPPASIQKHPASQAKADPGSAEDGSLAVGRRAFSFFALEDSATRLFWQGLLLV